MSKKGQNIMAPIDKESQPAKSTGAKPKVPKSDHTSATTSKKMPAYRTTNHQQMRSDSPTRAIFEGPVSSRSCEPTNSKAMSSAKSPVKNTKGSAAPKPTFETRSPLKSSSTTLFGRATRIISAQKSAREKKMHFKEFELMKQKLRSMQDEFLEKFQIIKEMSAVELKYDFKLIAMIGEDSCQFIINDENSQKIQASPRAAQRAKPQKDLQKDKGASKSEHADHSDLRGKWELENRLLEKQVIEMRKKLKSLEQQNEQLRTTLEERMETTGDLSKERNLNKENERLEHATLRKEPYGGANQCNKELFTVENAECNTRKEARNFNLKECASSCNILEQEKDMYGERILETYRRIINSKQTDLHKTTNHLREKENTIKELQHELKVASDELEDLYAMLRAKQHELSEQKERIRQLEESQMMIHRHQEDE